MKFTEKRAEETWHIYARGKGSAIIDAERRQLLIDEDA